MKMRTLTSCLLLLGFALLLSSCHKHQGRLRKQEKSSFGPPMHKTIYPEDGRTYNQWVGETIAGYKLADGWRRDTFNGGFNKDVLGHPFEVFNRVSKRLDQNFQYFYYRDGYLFTGSIRDTVLSESGNPYLLFCAECQRGVVNDTVSFSYLSSGKLHSRGTVLNGEMVGEWVFYQPQWSHPYKRLTFAPGQRTARKVLIYKEDGSLYEKRVMVGDSEVWEE